ncbi:MULTISPECIES: FBP domain-containing protein [unclassified Knoellia]|uniref:FBP domain-containing protein n=1 Tax=Knoellia altitudinis TaxID=3404795 RepID=UPI00360D5C8A
MKPLTEHEIRSSFVNASKREVAQASLPEVGNLDWERLEYLGWRDSRRPLGYAVAVLDDVPRGIILRAAPPATALGGRRRSAICAWCEDPLQTQDVSLYVAKRGGAAGRKGDTIGTLVCTEFVCSSNVRRKPTFTELGSDDPPDRELFIERRIEGLRHRAARFIAEVLATA